MKMVHKSWIKLGVVIILFISLLFPYANSFAYVSETEDPGTPEGMHFIVRHWHTSENGETGDAVAEDVEGYLREDSYSLKDKNGVYRTLEYKDGDAASITISAEPGKNETFTGFATAAGHAAVTRNDEAESVTITYDPDIHLAKVHAFYKKTSLGYIGDKELGGVETEIRNGIKYYNTGDPGLHTDKTSSVGGTDGRTFDLTLESWYVDDFVADIGMVLDASGSMAFTSEDLEPIRVDPELVQEYGTMRFLSEDQVNKLLDSGLTDNSKLSYSGYSYFVYDPRDDVKEYAPIGYWGGSAEQISAKDETEVIPPSDLGNGSSLIGYYDCILRNNGEGNYSVIYNLIGYNYDEENPIGDHLAVVYPTSEEGKVSNPTGTNPVASTGRGFWNENKALDLAGTLRNKGSDKGGAAVNVDAVPTNSSFTVSFAVKGSSSKPVMWIGDKSQKQDSDLAPDPVPDSDPDLDSDPDQDTDPVNIKGWYAIYVDTEQAVTKVAGSRDDRTPENGIDDVGGENAVTASLTSAEGDDGWRVCTYVFDYDEISRNTDVTVYVNGKESAKGTVTGIEITGDTVVILGGSAWQSDYSNPAWNGDGVQFLMDEMYVYNCALSGEDVENLFTYMTVRTDADELVYAAKTPAGDTTMARLSYAKADGSGAGWYYVSSGSDWEQISDENLLTAKSYIGIPANEMIYNYIAEVPEKMSAEMRADLEAGNTVQYYVDTSNANLSFVSDDGTTVDPGYSNWNGSILFYIDSQGYLRCLFNTGKAQIQSGSETGPNAGWENNFSFCSYVFQKEDLARIKTESLQRALGAFVTELNQVSPESRVAAVRFSTENIGGDLEQLVLLDWTDDTKESIGMLGLRRGDRDAKGVVSSERDIDQYNYVLTGGTVTWTGLQTYLEYLADTPDTGTDADQTKQYLIIFTDGKDTSGDEGKARAISLARKLKDEKGYTIFCVMMQSAGNRKEDSATFLTNLATGEEYVYSADDVEELTKVFTTKILDTIMNCLPDYTVRDYIDPRFDLAQGDSVIYLNADGRIVHGDNMETIGEEGYTITDNFGREAHLFYDTDKDMYYLEWENQIIPGCCLHADTLDVWKAQITVKAKEDFLGGNAVLTNGNEEEMNRVYDPQHDPTLEEEDSEQYPSKEFPCTEVNVRLLDLTIENGYQLIYLGETISPGELMEEFGNKVESPVYYEYLNRYLYWLKDTDEYDQEKELIEEALKSGKPVSVPYFYLPNIEGSNQVGAVQPGDRIGTLTYQWVECEYNEEQDKWIPKNGQEADYFAPYVTKDKDSRTYQLTITYEPFSGGEREKENDELIVKKDPAEDFWTVKPAVGETVGEISRAGMHTTEIVSGELVLEARIRLRDLRGLIESGKDNLTQTFTLTRTYPGIESNEREQKLEISFAITDERLREFAGKYGEDDYVSLFSRLAEPLPIGQYTVTVDNSNMGLEFKTISAVDITNGNGHFTEEYNNNENRYAAAYSEVQNPSSVIFYMGLDPNSANTNIDARLAHAVVTAALPSERAVSEEPKPNTPEESKPASSPEEPEPAGMSDDTMTVKGPMTGDVRGGLIFAVTSIFAVLIMGRELYKVLHDKQF